MNKLDQLIRRRYALEKWMRDYRKKKNKQNAELAKKPSLWDWIKGLFK